MGVNTEYTPENELCPHFDDINEELMKRLSSEVAAVRSSKKEPFEDLFEFTHRRMEVYEYGTGEIRNEDDLYAEFDEQELGNFTLVIRGPTGTGKSELCWALSHRLEANGRPVLHIDKNADLMSIMAEEIPDFYETHTGEQIEGATELDRLRTDIHEEKETVAEYAVSKAIIDLRNSDATINVNDREQIKEFVEQKLADLISRGEYDTDVDFVSESEVKNFAYLDIFVDQSAADAATMLTDALWDAIRSEYESPSLDTLLEEVGQAFTDTRPVIVFEDWSVTSLDAIRLRNYMERDNDNDRWDFIVAGTPDSFDELEFQTQTNEDRFEFYETTKEGEDQVLFLDESSAVDFIRPYLGYVKSIDGSVNYERDAENRVTDIIDPGERSRCDFCGFCDPEFRDLFPFNSTFVKRVFTGLPDDDKQPRKYVQTIFDILSDYYNATDDILPPSSSNELKDLTNDIDLADSVYINTELGDLAEWYGTIRGDEIHVDRRFAVSFGIDQTVDYEDYGVIAEEEKIRFPKRGTTLIDGSDDADIDSSGDEDDTSEGDDTEDEGETQSPEEKLIEDLRSGVQNWQAEPEEWDEHDVYLRKGLRDALERLTGGFRLWDDAPIEYRVGSGNPFVIGDELGDPTQIVIDQHDFVRSDLLELLEFGVMRSEDPSNADYDAFLSQTGTQLTEYAQEWRATATQHELEQSGRIFTNGVDLSHRELALSGYALCVLLDDPWAGLSADRIAAAFTDDEDLTLDDDLATALRDQLDKNDYQRVRRLFDHAEELAALFEDEFALTGNAVNRLRLKQYLDYVSPFEVIEGLAKSRINRVSGKVKFVSSGKNLTDVLEALYYLEKALDDVSALDAMTVRAERIDSELCGANMAYIENIVNDIQSSYGDILSGSQESLAKFANESQEAVDEVCTAAKLYLDRRDSSRDVDRWIALLSGLKLLESQTAERFEAAREFEVSTNGDGGLGSEFMEVSDEFV